MTINVSKEMLLIRKTQHLPSGDGKTVQSGFEFVDDDSGLYTTDNWDPKAPYGRLLYSPVDLDGSIFANAVVGNKYTVTIT